MHRRHFLRSVLAVSALFPDTLRAASERLDHLDNVTEYGYGPLQSDSRLILDLPAGFRYRVVSVIDQKMEDGLFVPGHPDSMHAWALDRNRVVLMCNHELDMGRPGLSAWRRAEPGLIDEYQSKLYSRTSNGTVAPGGVRRLVYNLKSGKLERQHMALSGTLRNCSGGPTPWNSWISCEETVVKRGQHGLSQDHGYCYEVPVNHPGMSKAIPIKSMGRFNHEAALVDPQTGIVYLTEDRMNSLFYRYIPFHRRKLASGGYLQALAIRDSVAPVMTGNIRESRFPVGQAMDVQWVTLQEVDSPDDSLRQQGISRGAAIFVRGEGLVLQPTRQGSVVWFVCTAGGLKQLGQIFQYRPSPVEGQKAEEKQPGRLMLFSEPNNPDLLKNGDNLTVMPNGDLLICEDYYYRQRLVGVTPEGQYYVLAQNARSASEFAGATFSPDGSTLFVNLQQQNRTLAISGPWKTKSSAH